MTIEDNFLSEITGSTDTFDLLNNMADDPGVANNARSSSQESSSEDGTEGNDQGGEQEEIINHDLINSTIESKNNNATSQLAIFAEQWKADGRLPKDFVVDDKLTEEKIDEALYNHKVKVIADQKLEEYIKEKGLSEEEVAKLRGQKVGVNLVEYDRLKAYTELSKITFDEESDSYQTELKDFLALYYKDLKIPAKKIESTVQADLDSDDLEDTIKEAKKHFSGQAKVISKNIEDTENQKIKERDDKLAKAIEKEKSFLKAEKVANVSFTPEQKKFLEKALFDKTEILTLPDGKTAKVTLYQKKLYEATNDPEKAFLSKARFILEELPADTPTEIASKGILKQLGKTLHGTKYTSSNNEKIAMTEL